MFASDPEAGQVSATPSPLPRRPLRVQGHLPDGVPPAGRRRRGGEVQRILEALEPRILREVRLNAVPLSTGREQQVAGPVANTFQGEGLPQSDVGNRSGSLKNRPAIPATCIFPLFV